MGVSINSESGNYSNHCLFFWTSSKDNFKTNPIVYKNTWTYLRFLVRFSQVPTFKYYISYVLRYRFPSLFAVDTFRGPWILNSQIKRQVLTGILSSVVFDYSQTKSPRLTRTACTVNILILVSVETFDKKWPKLKKIVFRIMYKGSTT